MIVWLSTIHTSLHYDREALPSHQLLLLLPLGRRALTERGYGCARTSFTLCVGPYNLPAALCHMQHLPVSGIQRC